MVSRPNTIPCNDYRHNIRIFGFQLTNLGLYHVRVVIPQRPSPLLADGHPLRGIRLAGIGRGPPDGIQELRNDGIAATGDGFRGTGRTAAEGA